MVHVTNINLTFRQSREVIGSNHKAGESSGIDEMGQQHSRRCSQGDGRHRADALRARLRSLRESARLWRPR